ncbi:MAG: protein-tyrosine-phosphatase [Lachnospiraceae bacterium]|nr:protein-tyrosine-phosphatase [Lachnospiraceae bacterium]
MGYIDIHCHVLPGVDDGSQSMDVTLEMLQIAQENGISDMIVTPHYKQGRVGTPRKAIGEMIEEVTRHAKLSGIDVRLHPGTEIYYNSSLEEKLESGWLARMNDTDYVLVEFSPMETYSYIRNAMDDIMSIGYRPVLAHVERYQCMLAKPANVKDLHDLGVKIQVNADSVAGAFGFKIKHFIKKLLKEQVIDFIGSDAHDEKRRTPAIAKCAEVLHKYCDEQYADDLLFGNAAREFFGSE